MEVTQMADFFFFLTASRAAVQYEHLKAGCTVHVSPSHVPTK